MQNGKSAPQNGLPLPRAGILHARLSANGKQRAKNPFEKRETAEQRVSVFDSLQSCGQGAANNEHLHSMQRESCATTVTRASDVADLIKKGGIDTQGQ